MYGMKRKEVSPYVTQSISIFLLNVFWVFNYFDGFCDEEGTIFVEFGYDFCFIKLNTKFGLHGVLRYC
jgi:hypothetical protein